MLLDERRNVAVMVNLWAEDGRARQDRPLLMVRMGDMNEPTEPQRILPGDALACVLEDLQAAAAVASLTAEGFGRWFASAVELLASVPDRDQRLSWAYCLAQGLAGGAKWRVVVLGDLLRFAEEVRRCRVAR